MEAQEKLATEFKILSKESENIKKKSEGKLLGTSIRYFRKN